MEMASAIGITAGVCISVASIPQIVTTIKKKKATDISPLMFAVLLAGNVLLEIPAKRRQCRAENRYYLLRKAFITASANTPPKA